MIEILRTTDPVELSWTEAVLAGAGIPCHRLDGYTSMLEGSIGAIPQRIVVAAEDAEAALSLLEEARAALLP